MILGSDKDYLFSSVIFSDGADCSSDPWDTLHLCQSSSAGGRPLVLAPCGTVSGPASAGGSASRPAGHRVPRTQSPVLLNAKLPYFPASN